jgi:hypothetical protein
MPRAKNLDVQVVFAVQILLDGFIGSVCVSYDDR